MTELKSSSRRRAVVAARDVAMYLARQMTAKSLKQIGDYFGGRDHTTVLHGCRKTETLIQSDPTARLAVLELRRGLAGCPTPNFEIHADDRHVCKTCQQNVARRRQAPGRQHER